MGSLEHGGLAGDCSVREGMLWAGSVGFCDIVWAAAKDSILTTIKRFPTDRLPFPVKIVD